MANLQKIKSIASTKGISMKEVAEQAELTPQGLSKIMRDGTTAIATLEKISNILGVSPAVFFDSQVGSANAYGDGATAINGSGNITIPQEVLKMLDEKDKRIQELTDKLISLQH